MNNRDKSLKLIIVMVGLLLVISFAIQYANHPPAPKTDEAKQSQGEESEHAKLVGMPPMDFTMASVSEGPIKISQYKNNKSIVLIFTNRNNTNFPKLLEVFSALGTEYGSKGVKPIIICMTEPIAKIREFAKKNNVKTTLLADINGAVGMQYLQVAMASCFVIGKNGLIYATISNVDPSMLQGELEKTINDMLSGKPPVSNSPPGAGAPSTGTQ